MKTHAIFLGILGILLLTGCRGAEQPRCLEGYDRHITFVDKIDHPANSLFYTVYGCCHVDDPWNDYPIEIRKRTALNIFVPAPSLKKVIDHEKAHRFEAVTRARMDGQWEEFERNWETLTGETYDEEDFAATYAKLRKYGIRSSKHKLVYDFMMAQCDRK